MHLVNRAAIVTALFGLLVAAVPATAQYGSPRVPGRSGSGTSESSANTTISIYPGATFINGNNSNAISGILAAAETGAATKDGKWAGQVGGFYFYHDSHSDLREIHVKGFYNRQWGLQFGVLGSNNTNITAVDGFFVYNYESKGSRPWGAQAGIGFFNQPAQTNVSFYLQGALPIAHNLDLTASYWYVRDVNVDIHRLAAGVALHF